MAKDNITNEKAIVVANKDRKRKRKPKVPGKGNTQIFHPKFSALKNDPEERSEVSEFSSAMVSGDAVVNKKEDLSEATYAHTDSAMKNPERSPSGNSNFWNWFDITTLAAAKSSTHSIQSLKSEGPDQLMSLPVSENNNVQEDLTEVAPAPKKSANSVADSVPQPGIILVYLSVRLWSF